MKYDTIDIPGPGPKVTAELYAPPGTGPAGLVVLAYGTDGYVDNERGPWRTMMRGYAEDLTTRGLFALIPDYFARTGSPHGGPAASSVVENRPAWAAALVDAVTHARTLPLVDPARIGLLGFSLGGYLCLLVRAATRPQALVEYFAPMFDGLGTAGTVPFAQIHHGTGDTGITAFANADAIAAILRNEKTDVVVFSYEHATHGFATTSVADQNAAADSKGRTVTFFARRLATSSPSAS